MNRRDRRVGRPVEAAGKLFGTLFTALTLACYSYTPVNLDSVAPGQSVRARVTGQALDRVRDQLGSDSRVVEGEVVVADNGSLLLGVTAATRQVGFHFESLNQRITLHDRDVLELERKELDRTRTYVVAAGAGVAVGAILFAMLSDEAGGGTKQPPTGGPSDDRITIFSIPVGWR